MPHDRDDDLERELRTHLEIEAEERMVDGLSEAEAQRAARRAFGSLTRTRQDARAVRPGAWLRDVRQDVAYGLRTLRRHRGFALVAVLTLGLESAPAPPSSRWSMP